MGAASTVAGPGSPRHRRSLAWPVGPTRRKEILARCLPTGHHHTSVAEVAIDMVRIVLRECGMGLLPVEATPLRSRVLLA